MDAIRENSIMEANRVSSWTQSVRSDSNPVGFFLGDSAMQRIDISTAKHPNTFAMVDDGDFERINKFKWCYSGVDGHEYVARKTLVAEGKERRVSLHRQVMNFPSSPQIDHKNGNKLDCRQSNLRPCTASQNGMNRRSQVNNTSGYKGVSWHKNNQRWVAHIQINKKVFIWGHSFAL